MFMKNTCNKRLATATTRLTRYVAVKESSILYPMSAPTDQEQPAPISGARRKPRSQQSAGTSRPAPRVATDPFVGVSEVVGLKAENFNEFLRKQDVAMVFFYLASVPASSQIKPAVIEAAKTTQRANHTYAAVNCTDEIGLCLAETIISVPSFKLYSLGHLVGQFDNTINAVELKKVVETAPVSQSPDTSPPKFTTTTKRKKN